MSSFRGYHADASPDTLSPEQSIRRPKTNPTDAKVPVIRVGRESVSLFEDISRRKAAW